MNRKLLTRLLCALLSVLMVVCAIPALVLTASAAEDDDEIDYTAVAYKDATERLEAMTLFYSDGSYELYCDTKLGIVAYRKTATGEVLFTNPWDMTVETNVDETIRGEEMSQIILTYIDSEDISQTLNSYTDAVLKSQISVKSIKNGVRVEYAIGQKSARILCPQQIERKALEEKIFKPIEEAVNAKKLTMRDYTKFVAYFNKQFYTEAKDTKAEAIAMKYPVVAEKNIDLYVCDINAVEKEKRWMESLILAFCPAYSFEEMDNDYDYVNYVEDSVSPPVFKMALEYTLTSNGLSVTMPGNGLRYDENSYRITDLQVLPYMGASNRDSEGYSFIPDGSGTLYELNTATTIPTRVYGEDYALFSDVSGLHNESVRVPVFGQVENVFTPKVLTPAVLNANGEVVTPAELSETEGTYTKRGFFAVIEKGEALASIAPNHRGYVQYASVVPSFITRQSDTSKSGWAVYASRRYTDDYSIRYVILSDDAKAAEANLSSYYECSWMGMACAYRDYLQKTDGGFNRLDESDVGDSIPLYIETFGCMDTVKKVLSMPVTVSVSLTAFDEVREMYDFLAGNGVTNVNFKLKGYANGGLYASVPSKLKWEKAVGGKSGFEDLVEDATAKGYGIYPDFDFVYTSGGGSSGVDMKENAARTIDNRYTSKRVYSATQQTLVSYYQMVLSPATYRDFYEKLVSNYRDYKSAKSVSLSTFGNALNSDYDENKTVLREEAKEYVIEALSYFRNYGYDMMLEGGNAFTWGYADHLIGVPLDSSRYTSELSAVPFVGVVLHGYVQFAGSAFNMEGDLSYAMLKAMENGASAYFILSYANTELLKEDVLLSQNYSVRYDIWQNRLVELYKELNSVLADVQTKLIIDHEFLDGSRVPDADELLKDIEDAAAEQAAAIAEKIEADRLADVKAKRNAVKTTESAISQLETAVVSVTSSKNYIAAQRVAGTPTESNYLAQAWGNCHTEASTANLKKLSEYLAGFVIQSAVSAKKAVTAADAQIVEAKKAYDYLVSVDANDQLTATARANLVTAINAYANLLNAYYGYGVSADSAAVDAYVNGTESAITALTLTKTGTAVTVANADLEDFILANNSTVETTYASIGLPELENAFYALLEKDGYYNPADSAHSAIDVQALIAAAGNEPITPEPTEPEPTEPDPGEGGDGEDVIVPDEPKSKYSVDNDIVYVTYGEKGVAYKSLILNFNDYTVQTTVNGVTYTVGGYDYIVIYH